MKFTMTLHNWTVAYSCSIPVLSASMLIVFDPGTLGVYAHHNSSCSNHSGCRVFCSSLHAYCVFIVHLQMTAQTVYNVRLQ